MTVLVVSGTSTGVGKTTVTAALARWLRERGTQVAAVKPFETGVSDEPLDAKTLAAASEQPDLAHDPAWYRASAPVAPYAASLEGEPPPDLAAASRRILELALAHEIVLVEGAGGLLVPLTRDRDLGEVAAQHSWPVLLVAPDRLGVLSDTLAIVEAARRRGATVVGIVLNRPDSSEDPSRRHNAFILAERTGLPVIEVGHGSFSDEAGAAILSLLRR